ncbi:DUF411 domain-containing protein [Enterovirga aerilata]|uniref:DUF411 domain-containing protein n=1 Tax=Enterovirga aerilata TaxID=2730920 RepID=A0A849IBZ1_9HYPH|nr:DUF411 domain-containing protein [Enterovirga sp. DB1703]NNM73939.1 DUF411 domain-containing protein [Enterovirga sp. DB1703]
MSDSIQTSRRALLLGLGSAALSTRSRAETAPEIKVTKDPSCGCCDAWVEHLKTAGFAVSVTKLPVNPLKARLGVPKSLYSCHTGQVADYVIEGHVPASAIRRLLAERPRATGLAVPGMPAGSPGMEVEGMEPETYDVTLFGPTGQRTFARYRGGQAL